MTIGEKIKARRRELKMTTEELGRLIGVQRSAVTKYEKGHIELKASQIQAIARALDVSPVDLLDDEDQRVEDSFQDRLEALHQDPRLCMLFDRSRKMSQEDVDFMIQMADRILKEREGE